MRRIICFLAVLMCTIPVGVSLTGCGKHATVTFCQGSSGPQTGQIYSIDLEPRYYGKSLAFGQIDSFATPTAADCQGTTESATFIYSSTNTKLVDINPSTGEICGGTWNRNSGNGVADYTTCIPATVTGSAQITASVKSGSSVTSNQVTVYVHPAVATMTLGNPGSTTSTSTYSCNGDNPSTDCCPVTGSTTVTASPYDGTTCISQKSSAQIVLRAYDASGNNITCIKTGTDSSGNPIWTSGIGHPTYAAVTSGLLSVDVNGVATALLPGTTTITATVARSTSPAGTFSVCPPASIALTSANSTNGKVTVYPNTTETMITNIVDTKGVTISGLDLTYSTTTPNTMSASSSGILATYPSTSSITAMCLPPTCNPAPTQNIGLFGTGKPVSSNILETTATGLSGTQAWIASTNSNYIESIDFVLNSINTPVALPKTPNSMVITTDGGTIYMGTNEELLTYSTTNNAVTGIDVNAQGKVLAVAPDASSIVFSDPNRKITYVYVPSSSTALATFGGVGVRAQYTPDSKTIYIVGSTSSSASPTLLFVYNAYTGTITYDMSSSGANDVVAGVPAVGALIGGTSAIVGRSYCANSTVSPISDYYPVAGTFSVPAERLAATNDGNHVLGVHVPSGGGTPVINDLIGTLPTNASTTTVPCLPQPQFSYTPNTVVVSGVNASSVTGIIPSNDGAISFLTYLAGSNPTTTGTVLPLYTPTTSGPGTITSVKLADGATAPVAGVFSTNNLDFYVGTSGDNLLHIINPTTLLDTQQINPRLPAATGSGYATPDLIVQKPRKST